MAPKRFTQSTRTTRQGALTRKSSSKQSSRSFGFNDIQASYASLLYGVLTLVVLVAIIFLGLNIFIKDHKASVSHGVITDQAAKTIAISPSISLGAHNLVTSSPTPTVEVIATQKITPTARPTEVKEATPTPTQVMTPTLTKYVMPSLTGGSKYTIKAGDTLWSIAENAYKSGYNWVDIARANNLVNPGVIHSGNELTLPKLVPAEIKPTTISPTPTQVPAAQQITTAVYVVKKDDDLWQIAVLAYGNGDKWVDIARANNLANPGLIFSGNVLKIPR